MRELGGVFVQAESELGAIYMVYGAAHTSKRIIGFIFQSVLKLGLEDKSLIYSAIFNAK